MTKRIFIIAGEASGDEHAAKLIYDLKKETNHELTFSGIGGQSMTDAGVKILYPLAQYGVTGFSEVLKQFKHIRSAYKLAKNHILENKIDLLILIDYPGFNLRFAKFAKTQGVKILYYISPQIWAWKAKRIHTIKKYVDVMAVILPFEKILYEKAGIPCYFVGNPLTETTKLHQTPDQLKVKHNLNQSKKIIGLLPGSRKNEIKTLLPIMLDAANKLETKKPQSLQFVLPVASSLKEAMFQPYLSFYPELDLKLISTNNSGIEIICCSESIMTASGTASLQAALLHKPMVIVYKTTPLTFLVATQVIRCAYIGLINLLAHRMIVPELIQRDLTSHHLAEELYRFISDKQYNHKIEQRLKKISKMLEIKSVDCKLAHLVSDLISEEQSNNKRSFKK